MEKVKKAKERHISLDKNGISKITNMLDNKPKQPSKSRTKIQVEINDDSFGTYNTNSHVKFKTSTLKSFLCEYSGAYIFIKGKRNNCCWSRSNQQQHKEIKIIYKQCLTIVHHSSTA